MPVQDIAHWPKCPTKLTEAQQQQFLNDGFLVFDDCLTPDELAKAREEISRLVAEMVETGEV